MQLWSESTRYCFDNPVNSDFGLWTPGSGRWSGSSPKFNHLVPAPCPAAPRKFVKIRSQLFHLSDGQTNRPKWKQPPSSAEVKMCLDQTTIVVINVRKKIKNVKKRVFYPKNKKTFVNVIKNVTLFFTCFWCRACWQNRWHQLNNSNIMVLHHWVWYNTKIK